MSEYIIEHDTSAKNFQDEVHKLFNKHNEEFKPNLDEYGTDMNNAVESYVKDSEIIIAKYKEDVVGILIITINGYREPISKFCPCVYINMALVDRNHRRNKLAKEMMMKCISHFNHRSYVCLRTESENYKMQNFCEKLAFETKAEEIDKGYKRLYYCRELNP